jgi:hypothetical protein
LSNDFCDSLAKLAVWRSLLELGYRGGLFTCVLLRYLKDFGFVAVIGVDWCCDLGMQSTDAVDLMGISSSFAEIDLLHSFYIFEHMT